MIFVLASITFIIHVCSLLAVLTATKEKADTAIKIGATIICLPPILLSLIVGFGG